MNGMQVLSRAISLAASGRISHPFIEHGAAIRPALVPLSLAKPDERAFRDHLLRRIAQPAGATQPQPVQTLPDVHLTWREAEVLDLLAEHLTNQEIAGMLVISFDTAKCHVRNVCRKLGVRTRREAVARGKLLGLIAK
jgi:LuxR family maltose regulon positive regulatory protein